MREKILDIDGRQLIAQNISVVTDGIYIINIVVCIKEIRATVVIVIA